MEYIFTRDGKPEVVEPEVWQWVACYSDGTILKQFDNLNDSDGIFHQFKEIDQSRLVAFKMINIYDGTHTFVLPFDPSRMKLIHYYLQTGLGVGTPDFRKIKSYVFGYESNGVKHLTVLTQSGEVVMCEDTSIISFE